MAKLKKDFTESMKQIVTVNLDQIMRRENVDGGIAFKLIQDPAEKNYHVELRYAEGEVSDLKATRIGEALEKRLQRQARDYFADLVLEPALHPEAF